MKFEGEGEFAARGSNARSTMGRETCKETSTSFSPCEASSTGFPSYQVQKSCKRGISNETLVSNAGFSIGERLRSSRPQDDNLGPGAYLSIWDQSRGPAYSFRSRRTHQQKDCHGPGPGEYYSGLGYYATKSSAPAFSMGARCGPSAFSTASGVGSSSGIKGSQGISPTATSSSHKFLLVPGPGSYNTSRQSSGPSYSMGMKASPKGVYGSQAPGPGSYDVTAKISGPSFSIAPKVRKQVNQVHMNPGPGTYAKGIDALTRGLSKAIWKYENTFGNGQISQTGGYHFFWSSTL